METQSCRSAVRDQHQQARRQCECDGSDARLYQQRGGSIGETRCRVDLEQLPP